MNVNDTKVLLSELKANANLARRVIEAEVTKARLIVDEEVHREFQDELLVIGNDIAMAEVLWRQYGRISVGSKRFAVVAKN